MTATCTPCPQDRIFRRIELAPERHDLQFYRRERGKRDGRRSGTETVDDRPLEDDAADVRRPPNVTMRRGGFLRLVAAGGVAAGGFASYTVATAGAAKPSAAQDREILNFAL